MTMVGVVGGLSHTQSGSVCSLLLEVEFLNSLGIITAFNQCIVEGIMRGDAKCMLLYQNSLSPFNLLCTLKIEEV